MFSPEHFISSCDNSSLSTFLRLISILSVQKWGLRDYGIGFSWRPYDSRPTIIQFAERVFDECSDAFPPRPASVVSFEIRCEVSVKSKGYVIFLETPKEHNYSIHDVCNSSFVSNLTLSFEPTTTACIVIPIPEK